MNTNKLNSLSMRTGIHTCMIVTREADPAQRRMLMQTNGITVYGGSNFKIDKATGEIVTSLKFNPNAYYGQWITSPDLFNALMQKAMNDVGIVNYELTRLDIAFDSCKDNDFELYSKLNRLLISLISISENLPDRYESKDFLKLDSLNIKAESTCGDKQVEAYNKKVEAALKNRQTDVTNRLEFRRGNLDRRKSPNDYNTLMAEWLKELRQAIVKQNIIAVETEINTKLVELYRDNMYLYNSKRAKQESLHGINRFITANQAYIYTKRQLIALYEAFGISRPIDRADNFKRNRYIEFFSQSDLERYINKLEATAEEYIQQGRADNRAIESL